MGSGAVWPEQCWPPGGSFRAGAVTDNEQADHVDNYVTFRLQFGNSHPRRRAYGAGHRVAYAGRVRAGCGGTRICTIGGGRMHSHPAGAGGRCACQQHTRTVAVCVSREDFRWQAARTRWPGQSGNSRERHLDKLDPGGEHVGLGKHRAAVSNR